MKAKSLLVALLLAPFFLALPGCKDPEKSGDAGKNGGGDETADAPGELVIYSGRSKSLVEPILKAYEEKTGEKLSMRFGSTADLALQINKEGKDSPADVYFAQDAGALGFMEKKARFRKLSDSVLSKVDAGFNSKNGKWVGISGRARVLAYSPERVPAGQIPKSVFELTDPKWKGKVGWPPTNASFKAFVTAMRVMHGEDKTKQWLLDMKANGTKEYAKNRPTIEAIANGEIDLGLVNHYYMYGFYQNEGPDFAAKNHFFTNGDVGGVVNVAGAGILDTSKRPKKAEKLIEFLLSPEAQKMFTENNFEYPLAKGAPVSDKLPPVDQLKQPDLDLSDLDDLETTVALLQETGVLE